MTATLTELSRAGARLDDRRSHRPSVLAAVRALVPTVRAHADETEQARRMPPAVFSELLDAGMFHLLTPRRFGGREVNVLTAIEAIETFATADGSSAWVLMINNNGGLISAYLDPAATTEIYSDDPTAVIGGALVPSGTARPVPGGYLVSGRWAFASGVEHSAWVVAACRVDDGNLRAVVLPADDVTVLDTWSVGGLPRHRQP